MFPALVKFIAVCEILFFGDPPPFTRFMNGEGREKQEEILMCSCCRCNEWKRSLLTLCRKIFSPLFTIIPPNLIQLL